MLVQRRKRSTERCSAVLSTCPDAVGVATSTPPFRKDGKGKTPAIDRMDAFPASPLDEDCGHNDEVWEEDSPTTATGPKPMAWPKTRKPAAPSAPVLARRDQPVVEVPSPSKQKGEGIEHHEQDQCDEDGRAVDLPERDASGCCANVIWTPMTTRPVKAMTVASAILPIAEARWRPESAGRDQACLERK